jgi:hypothetical protein
VTISIDAVIRLAANSDHPTIHKIIAHLGFLLGPQEEHPAAARRRADFVDWIATDDGVPAVHADDYVLSIPDGLDSETEREFAAYSMLLHASDSTDRDVRRHFDELMAAVKLVEAAWFADMVTARAGKAAQEVRIAELMAEGLSRPMAVLRSLREQRSPL